MPEPYEPWATSRDFPMPVNPDWQKGHISPSLLEVGDYDLDGVLDIVVLTEKIDLQGCPSWDSMVQTHPVLTYFGGGQTPSELTVYQSFTASDFGFPIVRMEQAISMATSIPTCWWRVAA